MTDSSKIVELTGIARGLGFEVTCHQDVSSVDPGTPVGARLHGNGVHFGGTVGECAAFLVGWGTLRARLLGELRASDPWDRIPHDYPAGKIVEGKVLKVLNFGAFVELERGIEGLVHASEISDDYVEDPRTVLQPDAVMKVQVLHVDGVDRKISLSIKGALRSRDVSDSPREARIPRVTQPVPGIGAQEVPPGSWWAPRGTDFLARTSARGGAGLPSRRSSRRLMVGDPGGRSVEPLPSRDRRQAMIAAWAELAFGREEATGLPQRGLRLLEEAIEVFQACGAPAELAHELVTHVFKRPCGMIGQELGGVAVSLLALAAAAGRSADAEECLEIHRVLTRPVEDFSRRNAAKNAAGFKISAAPAPEVVL